MGVKVREKVPGSGVWRVFVDHKGRRTSKRVGERESAEQLRGEIEPRIKLGLWLPEDRSPAPTVEEYYRRFHDTYLVSATRPATERSYETNFRVHILPVLGKKRLDEVRLEHMEKFIANLVVEKKLTKGTITTIVKGVKRLFNHAKQHRVVTGDNPAVGLSGLWKQARTRDGEIQPLTAEEVPVFLEAVRETAPEHYTLFLACIHAGLRIGEAIALRWGDIDHNGRFLTVHRSIDSIANKVLKPKNDKERRVDMSDELSDALVRLRQERQEFLHGIEDIPEWVFLNEIGGWIRPDQLRKGPYQRCLDKAGLRRLTLHDLRHTFASLLLTAGAPIAYVSEQMGHASIELTVKRYGHLTPSANRHHINNLPGALPKRLVASGEQI